MENICNNLFSCKVTCDFCLFILFMPANLNNPAVATGLEKSSFHSNPKEGQCQRMLKLQHNCTHFTCQLSNAQNSPSQASIVPEPRNCRCSSQIQKRQRKQIKLPASFGSQKKQQNYRKISTSASLTVLKPLIMWITQTVEKS